jgi:hypothetical protein
MHFLSGTMFNVYLLLLIESLWPILEECAIIVPIDTEDKTGSEILSNWQRQNKDLGYLNLLWYICWLSLLLNYFVMCLVIKECELIFSEILSERIQWELTWKHIPPERIFICLILDILGISLTICNSFIEI